MIYVRVKALPQDSVTAIADGSGGWTLAHYLAAQAVEVLAGERHPGRPEIATTVTADRTKAIAAARERKRQRDQDIAEGRIT